MSKRWHILVWLLPLPVIAWIGHGLLFTSFMLYDDEGYILLSLRSFAEHGALYDKVYSQYGPFFYAALDGLSALLRFEWTNTSGRWFTLVNWCGAALFCGSLVWRTSRNWPAALYAVAGVFSLLWIMLQEPVHPGGLITLLVAFAAWMGAESIRSGHSLPLTAGVGVIGAAVALTKINAGAFLVISAGLHLLIGLKDHPVVRRFRPVAWLCLGVAILPVALMHGLMDRHWVPTYALLASLSGLSAVLVTAGQPGGETRPNDVMRFISTGVACTALVGAWCLSQGTSVSGLLQGVFLDPMRHPGVYSFPVRWRPLVIPVAVLGLTIVCAWALRPRSEAILRLVVASRLLLAIGLAIALLPSVGSSQAALALCYGVPLAGVFAIPLNPSAPPAAARIRSWLALLLVLQSLQAFPIAGSQLNWGTFLWIPLFMLGIIDALEFLGSRLPQKWTRPLFIGVAATACGFAALQVSVLADITERRRADSVPLGLPGAEKILLPAPIASALHTVSTNARANADVLFSLPGAFSFNQWSDLPTPGAKNVTHWFSLLGDEDQSAIIGTMHSASRPAFVLQRAQLSFLAESGFAVQGRLVAHLRHDYHEVLRIDAFSLWVNKGRDIRPLNILEREPIDSSAESIWRLGLDLAPTAEPILRIDVLDTRMPVPRPAPPASDLRLTIRDGAGGARPSALPIAPGEVRRIACDWNGPDSTAAARHHVFRFVGANDRTVAFARFSDPIK